MTSIIENDGIINSRSGQFGRTVVETLTADIISSIWLDSRFKDKPHRLIITPSGANRSIRLPEIAELTDGDISKAKLHHSVLISNQSSTYNLVVYDSTGGSITNGTLPPGGLAYYIATTAPTTWLVVQQAGPKHASTHIQGGSDVIDGDKLEIDYTPSNYTSTIQSGITDATNQLTSHLKGLDTAIASLSYGFNWRDSVRVQTNTELPAYTFSAGSPDGVGTTLTAVSGAALTVDGVALNNGDRILVSQDGVQQSPLRGSDSGIYIVTNAGSDSPAVQWVLTRATDFDEDSEVVAGIAMTIEEGLTCADRIVVLATDNPITVDSTSLTWVKFTNLNDYSTLTISTGLQLNTGTTWTAAGGDRTLSLNAGLNNLNDVTISSLLDNQLLVYQDSPAGWINQTSGTLTFAGTRITNSASTYNPVTGNVTNTLDLQNLGSNFTSSLRTLVVDTYGRVTSSALATINDLDDVTISSLLDNQLLVYQDSPAGWVNQTSGTLTLSAGSGIGLSATTYNPVTGNQTITITNNGIVSTPTLQEVYDAGSPTINDIELSTTGGPIIFKDTLGGLGTIFQVSNNGGTANYLTINSSYFAAGGATTPTGSNAIVIGPSSTTGSVDNSIAIGNTANATGAASIAIGDVADDNGVSSSIVIGDGAAVITGSNSGCIAIGLDAQVGGTGVNDAICIGTSARASSDYAIAIGGGTSSTDSANASTAQSIAIGRNSLANGGASAVAIGYTAEATGTGRVAIGLNATASGNVSISIGELSTASNISTTAIGYSATASQDGGTALGASSASTGIDSLALGSNSTSGGNRTCAIGARATTSDRDCTAVGYNSSATVDFATSLGEAAAATNFNATSIGAESAAASRYSICLGSYARTPSGDATIAIGGGNSTSNSASASALGAIAIGSSSSSSGTNAVAIGGDSTSGQGATSSGTRAIAIGYNTDSTATDTITIGGSNTTSGTNSITISPTSTAMSVAATNACLLNTVDTTLTLSSGKTNNSIFTKVFATGERLAANISGSAIDYTRGNKLSWTANETKSTTGNVTNSAFTTTLELLANYSVVMRIMLIGSDTTSGTTWSYTYHTQATNTGTVSITSTSNIQALEVSGKSLNSANPLSFAASTTNIQFRLTTTNVTGQTIQWILAIDAVYNKWA